MPIEPFVSCYFYNDFSNLQETSRLALSDLPNRVIQIASESDLTFIIDGILGVQITIPPLPLIQSSVDFNQITAVISAKVNNILLHALNIRQDYYKNRNFISYSFFLETRYPFAAVEREHFLTQKLSKWIKDQLSCALNTKRQKEIWLKQTKSDENILHHVLTAPSDYENPVLYYLQELYMSYSLNEEICSVGNAFDRHLFSATNNKTFVIRIFKGAYDLGFTDDEYLATTLDLEIAFRTLFLRTAYASLVSQKLPDNIHHIDDAFKALYLNEVKWTLITVLKRYPSLKEPFVQIPADSTFWQETQIDKSWWDFIVKTLNPRIGVYILSPSQQPSAQ